MEECVCTLGSPFKRYEWENTKCSVNIYKGWCLLTSYKNIFEMSVIILVCTYIFKRYLHGIAAVIIIPNNYPLPVVTFFIYSPISNTSFATFFVD